MGLFISLVNSFSASAKGWGRPAIPTLLGPLRVWKYPRALRSNKVKKAIAAKSRMYVIKIIRDEEIIIIKEDKKSY